MVFAQIDSDNLVVGLHQTDTPFEDAEHFIHVGEEFDNTLLGKAYDATAKKFIENPNPPAQVEAEQTKPVTLDTLHQDNLTTMESNAELYEDLSTVKENQLTMMESIAELYEKSNSDQNTAK